MLLQSTVGWTDVEFVRVFMHIQDKELIVELYASSKCLSAGHKHLVDSC